jgi:P27 family predicted phage terminase small subunit
MSGTANSGGRNAKSAQMHVLTGTFRQDRHGDAIAPEPPKGRPEPPVELSEVARAEWDRMVIRLEQSGTLSRVDDAAVYQYARLFAETEQLAVSRDDTSGSIRIMEDNLAGIEGGDLVPVFQEITKLRQLEKGYATSIRQGRMAIRQYLVEFGMTPAARSRVKVPKSDDTPKAGIRAFQARKHAIDRSAASA